MVLKPRVNKVDFNQVTDAFEDGLEFFTECIAVGRISKLSGLLWFTFVA